MHKFASGLLSAGIALLLASAAGAQTFSHFETGTSTVFSNSGLSRIVFGLGLDNNTEAGGTGSDIVLANLTPQSTSATNDAFSSPISDYTITVNMTDDASSDTGSLTFTGSFGGSVATHAANLTNVYNAPLVQTITLGGNTYVVSLESFTPPSPPGGHLGAIQAHVVAVPEPGSIALLGVGALPLMGLIRRKR